MAMIVAFDLLFITNAVWLYVYYLIQTRYTDKVLESRKPDNNHSASNKTNLYVCSLEQNCKDHFTNY